VSEERKQLAAELLPHLAEILHHSGSKVSQQTVHAWLQVVRTLDITLKDLIDEIKLKDLIDEIRRQERQERRP
jgi:hypothetical protein